MKKKIVSLLTAVLLLLSPGVVLAQQRGPELPFNIQSKAAILVDADTGSVLVEKAPDEKLPAASVVKVMTLLLVMEALDKNQYSLTDMVPVSKRASSMGGSQALLDNGWKYPVGELIKSIILASANDSCVAMAEYTCGSVEAFVTEMNARAVKLGMNNTNFINCTGLPEAGQYTTARDISIMSRELIKHATYFQYSTIWTDEIQHQDGRVTTLTNTNKLSQSYEGCDGLKTGSTDEAGYCLSATAKRGDSRFIAVILGGPTSAIRFDEAEKLLNHGFANYKSIVLCDKDSVVVPNVLVKGGQNTALNAISGEKVSALVPKASAGEIEKRVEMTTPLVAPINRGDVIGSYTLWLDGNKCGSYALLADRDVKTANYWDFVRTIIRSFCNC